MDVEFEEGIGNRQLRDLYVSWRLLGGRRPVTWRQLGWLVPPGSASRTTLWVWLPRQDSFRLVSDSLGAADPVNGPVLEEVLAGDRYRVTRAALLDVVYGECAVHFEVEMSDFHGALRRHSLLLPVADEAGNVASALVAGCRTGPCDAAVAARIEGDPLARVRVLRRRLDETLREDLVPASLMPQPALQRNLTAN